VAGVVSAGQWLSSREAVVRPRGWLDSGDSRS